MQEVINQYKGKIRAIIKKITGSYNEDIEQEVYIKTWQNLDTYKEEGKFKQWIGTITANLCRDYFKSKEYRHFNISINEKDTIENITSSEQGQEEIIDAKKRQKIILKAVDSLPAKLRQIVILFEFEELSYEQIAHKTGLPQGTVKSRLFNARKLLSEKLKYLKENTNE